VWLIATDYSNPGNPCADSLMIPVNVNTYCTLNASFNYTINNGVVQFGNTSTGTNGSTNYNWNFGDGTNSSATNPTHTYPTGTYTVYLTATNGFSTMIACADSISQVINVTNTCVANAGFSMSTTGTPQYWNAYPASPLNVSNAVWSWGDGSYSTTLFTSHTYSAAGNYSICLSVTVACGATDTYCTTYNIYRSSQDMSLIYVNVVNPAIATGINATEAAEVAYSIVPNPSAGSFNLNLKGLSSANASISIYNLVGKLVYQSDSETNNGTLVKEVQLDGVANGVYFVKVNSDNHVFTKKLVINKQ
jgi:PKD repeat protein